LISQPWLLVIKYDGSDDNAWLLMLCVKQPSVVVQQLTLDIEQYLDDAVRTAADWGHRCLSFTDYELQIIQVSCRHHYCWLNRVKSKHSIVQ